MKSDYTVVLNMWSKEVWMEVQEAIIRLKMQHRSIREITETPEWPKSTVWYIILISGTNW